MLDETLKKPVKPLIVKASSVMLQATCCRLISMGASVSNIVFLPYSLFVGCVGACGLDRWYGT